MPNRAAILKQKFQNSVGLPFAKVLPAARIEAILQEQSVAYRATLYSPMVVIWAWLSQVLAVDQSLSNTVQRVLAWLAPTGTALPSEDTGGYSKARKRLPLAVMKPLLQESAQALQREITAAQGWCGRRIKAYDGTTVLMMDTESNQASYPQHGNQKPGCGSPIAKLVVWFCVTTGTVLTVAIANWKTSEWQLARQLYGELNAEDVVVADSAYGTYADLALVKATQADAVFRKHHARHCDFRRGKKLGLGDHIVRWQRPARCPKAMTQIEFEALPEHLEVREVHLSIQTLGFRPKTIILVTTLLDPKRYPKAQLAELYRLRWQATEVNLKHLKTTLQMEMIAAKTPEMVQKDIYMHLLAYNLLRTLMWQAAQTHQQSPLQISLKATRQSFNQFQPLFAQGAQTDRSILYRTLNEIVAALLIPERPNRSEPRVVKRRPKAFPRMQKPRHVLKTKLAA